MAKLKPFRENYYLWHYVPSTAAAVLFVVLFSLASSLIIWRIVKTRNWYCIPFVVGGLFEIIGYIARATAENRTDLLQPYVVQSIFILLAPAFFAATIYMALGRLMRHLKGERHSILPVRWLTGAFVGGDIISFFIMGSGAGVMVSGKGTMDTGRKIIIGGFFLQILMMILFIITAIMFHVGMRHWPSGPSLNPRSSWRTSMRMLYVASVLIMARSLFRAVEYILGPEGYPLRHEWTLYVFDALLMLCVMGVFGCFFPRTGNEADEGNGWQVMDVFHVK